MKTYLPRLSFHSRILMAFVGLIVLALLGTLSIMYFAARRNGEGLAEQQLLVANRVVGTALKSRDQEMRAETAAVAADFGFRQAVTSRHKLTITSALENQRERIHADTFALIDLDGSVFASANEKFESSALPGLAEALHRARLHDSAPTIVNDDGQLLQLVIIAVKAPDLVGWACAGRYLDDDFAQQVKNTAGAEISLLARGGEASRFVVGASTLTGAQRISLEQSTDSLAIRDPSAIRLKFGGESYLTVVAANQEAGLGVFSAVLQLPMTTVAAPVIALRRDMVLFGGLVSAICLVAAVLGARLLAQPVRALSNAARSLSMSKGGVAGANGDDELAHVARAFHSLARRAHYDGLTGLPNRALLNERLKESLERMQRANDTLAVVFIDLNGFKKINDTLGHEMGDLVLRKTAQRLARSVIAPDTVARLGGDEFVLVLEKADQAGAMQIVQGLADIVGRSMVSPSGPIKVGMSAGIAMYPALTSDQEELMHLADAAMYQSKTRKAGPVMATKAETVELPVSPLNAAAPVVSGDTLGEDTVSVAAWKGRDLVTQSTRALSAIGPKIAELPENELKRLIALRRLKYLDKPSRESFDRITRLAARSLNVPIALVSLVDEHRQWFLSRVGLEATETPRDVSFCAHAIFDRKPLIVPDATRDDRFCGNPLVLEDPKIRAYAGIPICTPEGYAVGTLCVVDIKPHEFGEAELNALHDLAHIIEDMIRIREFTLVYEQRRRQDKSRKTSNAEFHLID